MFAGQFLEFGKYAFQTADLRPPLCNEIYQRTDHEITLGTEALSLTLIGYPLIAKNLENEPDPLKHLPSEAPALLAFPYALSEIDNVSGPINEHESKRDQGINTADAEAGEEKLEGVPICIAPMLTR